MYYNGSESTSRERLGAPSGATGSAVGATGSAVGATKRAGESERERRRERTEAPLVERHRGSAPSYMKFPSPRNPPET